MFHFMVEMLARVLPHAERRMIPGSGHGPHVTHPAQYADIVLSFIREFASGQSP